MSCAGPPPASRGNRCLEAEGVEVCHAVVDLERYGFQRFVADRPLEELSRLQERIVRRVQIPAAAADAAAGRRRRRSSYAAENQGVAAYCLVDTVTGALVWSTSIRRCVRFPYISSYLTFRELPLLLALLEEVRTSRRSGPVVLVDGTGILHPRRVGIATHLGVAAS